MGDTTLTRTAEFTCKSRAEHYLEILYPVQQIQVTVSEKVTPEEIEAKFRAAAEEMRKNIFGCYDVKFVKFFTSAPLPTESKPCAEKATPQEKTESKQPTEITVPMFTNSRWK